MYLKQYLQPECVGIRSQTFNLSRCKRCGNQQNGIGSGNPCLTDLVGIDDEIFPQDGDGQMRPCRLQVIQIAGKVVSVGQNGEGRSSGLCISGGDGGYLCKLFDKAL